MSKYYDRGYADEVKHKPVALPSDSSPDLGGRFILGVATLGLLELLDDFLGDAEEREYFDGRRDT